MVLATGDFFSPPDNSPEQTKELDALLNGQLEGSSPSVMFTVTSKDIMSLVPIQMYITQGQHPIPPSVLQKIEEHGQICKNVIFLGKVPCPSFTRQF